VGPARHLYRYRVRVSRQPVARKTCPNDARWVAGHGPVRPRIAGQHAESVTVLASRCDASLDLARVRRSGLCPGAGIFPGTFES